MGFDFKPAAMGALTGSSKLTYRLSDTSMKVHVSDLRLWNGSTSTPSSRPNYTYLGLSCGASDCHAYEPGNFGVLVGFYRDGTDPSGYAAGVVNDYRESYAGAFAADKD